MARPRQIGARAGEPSPRLKRPLCFGHSMMLALHQAVGEVGVAVRADAVGGVELARFVAVEREGLLSVVEADDVGGAQVGAAQTSIQPSASGAASEE